MLISGMLSGLPAHAQGGGWTTPFEVSSAESTPSSWFSDLAVGPNDDVHIVWSSGKDPKDVNNGPQDDLDLLMYRSLRGDTWSEINDIDNTGIGGYTVRNSIVMGRDGRLHVLVRRGLQIFYTSAPWDSATSAQAWSEPRPINGGTGYFTALAVDSKGRLHALWTEAIPVDPKAPPTECDSCSDVFYRQSDDSGLTWTTPTNLSQSLLGSVKPQIQIDKNDNVHVVWEEGFDWYTSQGNPTAGMYRRSLDGGRTWGPPVQFTLPKYQPPPQPSPPDAPPRPTPEPVSDAPRQMALGLFNNLQPMLVYRSSAEDRIYFQFSPDDGSTWSAPRPLPGVFARYANDGDQDAYAMATDGAGTLHLIVAGFLPGELEENDLKLLHLSWTGRSWSAPEVVASVRDYKGYSAEIAARCPNRYPETRGEREALMACQQIEQLPEWPRIAISNGNKLHLTWFSRRISTLHQSEKGGYQVWYSSRQLDLPAVVPLPFMTPAPTAAPPAPTATPAPPPTPTLSPEDLAAAPIEQPANWESYGMTILGMAALPVLGFLGAIVVVRGFRMRRRGRGKAS